LVHHQDRAEKPVHRHVGGDHLKSPPSTSPKAISKVRDHAPDLSEVRDLLRSATLVTIGVVAISLVIGASRREPHSIRDCLMIAGWLLLLAWMGTLLVVAAVSFAVIIRWLLRRVARSTSRKATVGGVADEWLDGPP
jgi:hypothetical protein